MRRKKGRCNMLFVVVGRNISGDARDVEPVVATVRTLEVDRHYLCRWACFLFVCRITQVVCLHLSAQLI